MTVRHAIAIESRAVGAWRFRRRARGAPRPRGGRRRPCARPGAQPTCSVWRNETGRPSSAPAGSRQEFYTAEEAAALVEARCGTSRYRACAGRPAGALGAEPRGRRASAGTYNRSGRIPASRSASSRHVADRRAQPAASPSPRRCSARSDRNAASYGLGPLTPGTTSTPGSAPHDGLPGSVWTGTAGGPRGSRSPGWLSSKASSSRTGPRPQDGRPHGNVRHLARRGVGRWRARRSSSRRATSSTRPANAGSPPGACRRDDARRERFTRVDAEPHVH